jgi:ornithine cyclodeaminase
MRHVEVLPDGENQNLFALMPAYLGKNRFFGAKIITAFPENPQKNLASQRNRIGVHHRNWSSSRTIKQ